jgi:hypothetical protein
LEPKLFHLIIFYISTSKLLIIKILIVFNIV